MKNKIILVILIIFKLSILINSIYSVDNDIFPDPENNKRVYDYANIIDENDEISLEEIIYKIDDLTTAEIAVVIINSLQGFTIEEYANHLFNKWGIGKKDINNGILILLAVNERKARIETGIGMEYVLTNDKCIEILLNEMVPSLKENNYYKAIYNLLSKISNVLISNIDEVKGKSLSKIVTDKADIYIINNSNKNNMLGKLQKDVLIHLIEKRGEWIRAEIRFWIKVEDVEMLFNSENK